MTYDRASQRFEINPQAIECILEMNGTVGLIFNIGEPKIGKTFLINEVMDLDAGFPEQGKGIKIWTRPFFRDDENLFLFFVDVQGLDNDERFANFVWMMSFLVGTIVLYQSQGDITERTFDNLAPLNFVSTALRLSADEIENSYMMSYYAPKLIWVLKDHRRVENSEGKLLQSDQYLESCLLEPSNNPEITAIKRFVSGITKERTCVAFGPFSNIDDLYSYTVSVLKERIYSRSFCKYFDGVPFNARMLVNFMVGYVELYNADSYIEYYDM